VKSADELADLVSIDHLFDEVESNGSPVARQPFGLKNIFHQVQMILNLFQQGSITSIHDFQDEIRCCKLRKVSTREGVPESLLVSQFIHG
jgi:hypothetical protein